MALLSRKINVTFSLAQGSFSESGTNSVTLPGLRISAKILKAGGPSMGKAQLLIYGMTLSQMNKLSTLGMVIQLVPRNTVLITAGDDVSGMGTVFIGTITSAYADFQAAPEVPFNVEAHTGIIEAVTPVDPLSYSGSTDVATVMSSLATQAGLAFENNGVSTQLSNPYFPGSVWSQMQAAAKAANIGAVIDNGNQGWTGSSGGSSTRWSDDRIPGIYVVWVDGQDSIQSVHRVHGKDPHQEFSGSCQRRVGGLRPGPRS